MHCDTWEVVLTHREPTIMIHSLSSLFRYMLVFWTKWENVTIVSLDKWYCGLKNQGSLSLSGSTELWLHNGWSCNLGEDNIKTLGPWSFTLLQLRIQHLIKVCENIQKHSRVHKLEKKLCCSSRNTK